MAKIDNKAQLDDLVRDVFDTDEIESKTELTSFQIETSNKLKTMSKVFGSGLLSMHIKDFMILQKSKDRSSLREFVASISAKKELAVNSGKGFFKNLLG